MLARMARCYKGEWPLRLSGESRCGTDSNGPRIALTSGMRRFFSALMLLALPFAQAAPRPCTAAAERGGSPHDPAATALHVHGAGHGHVAAGTAAEASAGPTVPAGHDGSCTELMHCHWVAVPAAEPAPPGTRAALADAPTRRDDALAIDAAALLTPPPKRIS